MPATGISNVRRRIMIEKEGAVLELEAFVVINYTYQQGKKQLTRQLVAVVTEVGARDVEVKFLRPYGDSKSVFVFPQKPDEDTVTKDQIAKVL
ncbi:hypothetical protein ANN_22959 [Periplaneta americana]|uniref:Uncharacterized protein n=1 Tax=Periplaneta americana TaxID=6978 RepID=A0ABQ8SJR2_PERAM|nr:hypothetical protein ANN_22959 [Periplaneta americana]